MAKIRIPQQYLLKVIKRYEFHPRAKVKAFYTDEQKRVRPIVETKTEVERLQERREELKQKIEEKKRGLEAQIVYKPKPARTRPSRPIFIDPVVRQKYKEWLQASEKWRTKKMLPIASLQTYYKSRQKAFVEQGGDPDVFEDKFSNIDMSVAVDGWLDLDQELKKHLVTPPKIEHTPTSSEVEELIREHEEQERMLQEMYEEYLKSFEEEREDKEEGVAS
ncbi:MAG: hypothetical protein QXS29_06025 [Nitrososphaeria archaeon]